MLTPFLLKNVRCSEEIWQIDGITLEEALEKAKSDPRVKALHWFKNNGGDGRIGGVKGWYQGAGGSIGTIVDNNWDTIILNRDNNSNNKHKFSLCIPTMDRYDQFLSIFLPIYANNPFIDEIIISDENGNDIKKIKKNLQNLDKFKFNINTKKLGAFYNKIKCCQLAKNDWIALIDSDNLVSVDYFLVANNFLNNNDIKVNTILAPSYAKPSFNFNYFSGMCFKKGNFKNIPKFERDSIIVHELMNTGNYILNKYLIDNIKIDEKNEKLTRSPVDVLLFITILFEQLDLEMYIVPDLYYHHTVHDGSFYTNESKNYNNEIEITHERFWKLLDEK